MVLNSPNIRTRELLPTVLRREHGIGRLAIEIGVLRGEYMVTILEAFDGKVIGIDPYVPFWEAPMPRDEHLTAALANLKPHGLRADLRIAMDSHELADEIVGEFGNPDFVYIDGDHHYEPCKQDIEIWWPRLADNGVLAGHDYTHRHPGVVKAVHELANEEMVYTTHESDWRSWYCFKNYKAVH